MNYELIDMAVNWPQRRVIIDLAICEWWPV